MLLLSQAPNGALSARRCPSSTSYSSKPNHHLFSKSRTRFLSQNSRRTTPHLSVSKADGASEAGPSARPLSTPSFSGEKDDTVFVGDTEVPLEGVIQFEKPGISSKLVSWAQVGLLAGGDVLCLLVFSAIGRFSHGLPVIDFETLKTADPFVAGWIFSAYFFGAYGDDGKGLNGSGKAIAAAAKSWAVGIPLGIGIRALTSGHIPQAPFILVTMGSTGILLVAWRSLVSNLLSGGRSKQNDIYRRGSPFELFEELFASDRNMEVVLDKSGVELSHLLVIDMLERFCHAHKPAYRFFRWARKRSDFSHDSNTYSKMLGVLRKTRQFETMVALLEEMINKGMKAPQLDYNKFEADFSRAGKPDVLYELAQKMNFSGNFAAPILGK